MLQPRAGAPGASSRVQEHPPTRVLGLAGGSVTTRILTREGGGREAAAPVPRGVTLEATDGPRMGDTGATPVGVSYPGGERRRRPQEISRWLPLLLLLLRGQDKATKPTLHWGQRAGGTVCQGLLRTPREPSLGPQRPHRDCLLHATDPTETTSSSHVPTTPSTAHGRICDTRGLRPPSSAAAHPLPATTEPQLLLFPLSSTFSVYICAQGFYPGLALSIKKENS